MSSGLQPLRGLRCSQARLWHSLLHWAYFGLFRALRGEAPSHRARGLRALPQFAMAVLLRLTACSTPTSQFSMVASLRSQSSLEMLPASLGSSAAIAPSIRNGRPAAPFGLQYSLAHWAYYGLFRALRAAFVRPTGCAASFALIGLPLRLFPPPAAAKLRPSRALPWVF